MMMDVDARQRGHEILPESSASLTLPTWPRRDNGAHQLAAAHGTP
jgi:hypothetical protein